MVMRALLTIAFVALVATGTLLTGDPEALRMPEASGPVEDVSSGRPEPAGTAPHPGTVPDRSTPAESDVIAPSTRDRIDRLLARRAAEEAGGGPVGSEDPVPRQEPVRHPARLHDSMLTPGNFEYVGGFRPPHTESNGSSFGYGGWGIAWRDGGDPDGPDDGFPGSLFLVGNPQHQRVAEITIPVPRVLPAKSADRLPVAEVLQGFGDVTGGLQGELTGSDSEAFQLGGLHVIDDRLHWTLYKYYNVAGGDYPSHGVSDPDLRVPMAAGPWHLGPSGTTSPEWHSYKHAGYIFEIPSAAAERWFGGKNLISGLQISTGLQYSSQGPAMFAYRLPEDDFPGGFELDARPLCWYSQEVPLAGHHPADRWTGGAWLTLGDKQAVIVIGRRSYGPVHYGEPRPGDCSPYKGYHGAPYDVEVAFYSPASLIHAAHGSLPPLGLQPWLRWTDDFDGGSISQYLFPTCSQEIGGLTYDRDRQLLYLTQVDAALTSDNPHEPLPVVHVFRIVP